MRHPVFTVDRRRNVGCAFDRNSRGKHAHYVSAFLLIFWERGAWSRVGFAKHEISLSPESRRVRRATRKTMTPAFLSELAALARNPPERATTAFTPRPWALLCAFPLNRGGRSARATICDRRRGVFHEILGGNAQPPITIRNIYR